MKPHRSHRVVDTSRAGSSSGQVGGVVTWYKSGSPLGRLSRLDKKDGSDEHPSVRRHNDGGR